MKEHTCNTYIIKSNLGCEESWVIQSNKELHMCGYMVDKYMVANLILLCSLKTYLSLLSLKIFLQENIGYLIHLFSFIPFSGGYLSTHCFRYLRHLSIFFNFFLFLNNFCIAHASSLQQNFWEIVTRTWNIYLVDGKNLSSMFLIFTPSVGVKHFWVDLNGKTCFCAYPQCRSSAYVDEVYVILILRAWQTSHKGE
jgi:hypothetical protein